MVTTVAQREEPRIVSVDYAGPMTDIGAAACKSMPAHARYRYYRPITYRTEDGREFSGLVKGVSKPKMLDEFSRKEGYARNGQLFASIRGGEYQGTIVKMSLMMR